MELKKIFVDFNAYFASAEQYLRPELRSLPLAVVPVLTDTACCIAVSYDAKRTGVATGMSVREARRCCPDIHFVESRPEAYVALHHKLVALVESCLPVDQVLSIDEMVATLPPSMQNRESARLMAKQIKERLMERMGPSLLCSIGVASNTFLAKTASDMQKPDGLTILESKSLPEALYRLKLSDLCGIGSKMLERLRREGISTVEMLCAADVRRMRKVWGGIEGERMYGMLRGHDVWRPDSKRSEIGHSHVLPPELRREDLAYAVLHKLLHKAAMRLRKNGFCCSQISVKVNDTGGAKWKDQMRVSETQSSRDLGLALAAIWQRRSCSDQRPFFVAITLKDLNPLENCTRSLYASIEERDAVMDATVDRLNAQYGPYKIYRAVAHDAIQAKAAPMRIPFSRIPDPTREADSV